MTPYDLTYDIVFDKRFTRQGGHILMEVNVSSSYEKLNTFLRNDALADDEMEANIPTKSFRQFGRERGCRIDNLFHLSSYSD